VYHNNLKEIITLILCHTANIQKCHTNWRHGRGSRL